MTDIDLNRNELGRFVPQNNANPTGENGHTAGWQRFGTRAQKWLDMPVEELKALIGDQPRMMKLSGIDFHIVRRIGNMLFSKSGKEAREEGESVLSRIEGAPKRSLEVTGANGASIFPTRSDEEIINTYLERERDEDLEKIHAMKPEEIHAIAGQFGLMLDPKTPKEEMIEHVLRAALNPPEDDTAKNAEAVKQAKLPIKLLTEKELRDAMKKYTALEGFQLSFPKDEDGKSDGTWAASYRGEHDTGSLTTPLSAQLFGEIARGARVPVRLRSAVDDRPMMLIG